MAITQGVMQDCPSDVVTMAPLGSLANVTWLVVPLMAVAQPASTIATTANDICPRMLTPWMCAVVAHYL